MRAIVSGFAMAGLLILAVISTYRHPVTIWLFVALFTAILILCAASAGKRTDQQAYSWTVREKT